MAISTSSTDEVVKCGNICGKHFITVYFMMSLIKVNMPTEIKLTYKLMTDCETPTFWSLV